LKGPQTFGLGNSGVFLPLQTITENWQDIVGEINNQSAVNYLPGQTDATVAKGYAVQLEHIAKQYGSLGSAVMELPFSGAARSIQVVLKPLSRGSININPDDPYGEVVADFGTFTNPVDLKVMTAIFKISRKWLQAPAHQQLSPVEDPKTANLMTDQEIENVARATINPSFYHPSCTNSMLPKDLGGVVGPDLLVHGTSGLSVVDASIMPLIPGTHLCATVYAIAEKVSLL
jgi:choline dehydrogenase-like flavoprotein